ncbi:MAG: hypothetical protein ACXV5M_12665, partial [Candidatus Angelobacter sp.]
CVRVLPARSTAHNGLNCDSYPLLLYLSQQKPRRLPPPSSLGVEQDDNYKASLSKRYWAKCVVIKMGNG